MKQLCLLLSVVMAPVLCSAQGFYFRTGLGYAIPQAGQTLDGTGTPYNGSFNSATNGYKIKSMSFSAGVQAYAGFGYMVTKNVGVQAELNLGLAPRKYTCDINNVQYTSGVEGKVSIKQQAVLPAFLDPAIVIQNGGEKLNIYSRFGPAIPLNTSVIFEQVQTKKLSNVPGAGTTVEDFTFMVTNSFSVGMAAAAGMEYKLNNRISLWGEFSMLSMSVYIKHSELTALVVDGTSYSVPVSSVPPVNYNRNGVMDSTGTTQPAYSMPFSNFAFNAGIKITMAKKSRTATPPGEGNRSKRPAPSRFR